MVSLDETKEEMRMEAIEQESRQRTSDEEKGRLKEKLEEITQELSERDRSIVQTIAEFETSKRDLQGQKEELERIVNRLQSNSTRISAQLDGAKHEVEQIKQERDVSRL